MEDAERVKKWYVEKGLIVAFPMITCVGTEKSLIPDNMVIFKKIHKLTNFSFSYCKQLKELLLSTE